MLQADTWVSSSVKGAFPWKDGIQLWHPFFASLFLLLQVEEHAYIYAGSGPQSGSHASFLERVQRDQRKAVCITCLHNPSLTGQREMVVC